MYNAKRTRQDHYGASPKDFFLFLPTVAGGDEVGTTSTICGVGAETGIFPLSLCTGVEGTPFAGLCL